MPVWGLWQDGREGDGKMAGFQGRGVFDTEEVKATIRRLTDALNDYLTMDVDAMERAATIARYQAPNPEMLVKAQEQLDMMRARLEDGRTALEHGSLPDGVKAVFRAGVLGPLEDQIRVQETYLSNLQAAMEKADA